MIDKTRQMVWSQFSIKILGVHFGNSGLDKFYLDKTSNSSAKIINIWNSVQLSLGWKQEL